MTLPDLLKTTVERGGSDLHLSISTPPQIRVDGDLVRLEGEDLRVLRQRGVGMNLLARLIRLDVDVGAVGTARRRRLPNRSQRPGSLVRDA